MPQGPGSYVNVCVAAPNGTSSSDVVVIIDGVESTKFMVRPLPGGGIQVCVRVRSGEGSFIRVDVDSKSYGAGVP